MSLSRHFDFCHCWHLAVIVRQHCKMAWSETGLNQIIENCLMDSWIDTLNLSCIFPSNLLNASSDCRWGFMSSLDATTTSFGWWQNAACLRICLLRSTPTHLSIQVFLFCSLHLIPWKSHCTAIVNSTYTVGSIRQMHFLSFLGLIL